MDEVTEKSQEDLLLTEDFFKLKNECFDLLDEYKTDDFLSELIVHETDLYRIHTLGSELLPECNKLELNAEEEFYPEDVDIFPDFVIDVAKQLREINWLWRDTTSLLYIMSPQYDQTRCFRDIELDVQEAEAKLQTINRQTSRLQTQWNTSSSVVPRQVMSDLKSLHKSAKQALVILTSSKKLLELMCQSACNPVIRELASRVLPQNTLGMSDDPSLLVDCLRVTEHIDDLIEVVHDIWLQQLCLRETWKMRSHRARDADRELSSRARHRSLSRMSSWSTLTEVQSPDRDLSPRLGSHLASSSPNLPTGDAGRFGALLSAERQLLLWSSNLPVYEETKMGAFPLSVACKESGFASCSDGTSPVDHHAASSSPLPRDSSTSTPARARTHHPLQRTRSLEASPIMKQTHGSNDKLTSGCSSDDAHYHKNTPWSDAESLNEDDDVFYSVFNETPHDLDSTLAANPLSTESHALIDTFASRPHSTRSCPVRPTESEFRNNLSTFDNLFDQFIQQPVDTRPLQSTESNTMPVAIHAAPVTPLRRLGSVSSPPRNTHHMIAASTPTFDLRDSAPRTRRCEPVNHSTAPISDLVNVVAHDVILSSPMTNEGTTYSELSTLSTDRGSLNRSPGTSCSLHVQGRDQSSEASAWENTDITGAMLADASMGNGRQSSPEPVDYDKHDGLEWDDSGHLPSLAGTINSGSLDSGFVARSMPALNMDGNQGPFPREEDDPTAFGYSSVLSSSLCNLSPATTTTGRPGENSKPRSSFTLAAEAVEAIILQTTPCRKLNINRRHRRTKMRHSTENGRIAAQWSPPDDSHETSASYRPTKVCQNDPLERIDHHLGFILHSDNQTRHCPEHVNQTREKLDHGSAGGVEASTVTELLALLQSIRHEADPLLALLDRLEKEAICLAEVRNHGVASGSLEQHRIQLDMDQNFLHFYGKHLIKWMSVSHDLGESLRRNVLDGKELSTSVAGDYSSSDLSCSGRVGGPQQIRVAVTAFRDWLNSLHSRHQNASRQLHARASWLDQLAGLSHETMENLNVLEDCVTTAVHRACSIARGLRRSQIGSDSSHLRVNASGTSSCDSIEQGERHKDCPSEFGRNHVLKALFDLQNLTENVSALQIRCGSGLSSEPGSTDNPSRFLDLDNDMRSETPTDSLKRVLERAVRLKRRLKIASRRLENAAVCIHGEVGDAAESDNYSRPSPSCDGPYGASFPSSSLPIPQIPSIAQFETLTDLDDSQLDTSVAKVAFPHSQTIWLFPAVLFACILFATIVMLFPAKLPSLTRPLCRASGDNVVVDLSSNWLIQQLTCFQLPSTKGVVW